MKLFWSTLTKQRFKEDGPHSVPFTLGCKVAIHIMERGGGGICKDTLTARPIYLYRLKYQPEARELV